MTEFDREFLIIYNNLTNKSDEIRSKTEVVIKNFMSNDFFFSSSLNFLKNENNKDKSQKIVLLSLIKKYIFKKILNKGLYQKLNEEDLNIKKIEIYNVMKELFYLFYINKIDYKLIKNIIDILEKMFLESYSNKSLFYDVIIMFFNNELKNYINDWTKNNVNQYPFHFICIFNIILQFSILENNYKNLFTESLEIYDLIIENMIIKFFNDNSLTNDNYKKEYKLLSIFFDNFISILMNYKNFENRGIKEDNNILQIILNKNILNLTVFVLNYKNNNFFIFDDIIVNLKLKCLILLNQIINYINRNKLSNSIFKDEYMNILFDNSIKNSLNFISELINNKKFISINENYLEDNENFDNLLIENLKFLNNNLNRNNSLQIYQDFVDKKGIMEIFFFKLIKLNYEENEFLESNSKKFFSLNFFLGKVKKNFIYHYKNKCATFLSNLSIKLDSFSYTFIKMILNDLILNLNDENDLNKFELKNIQINFDKLIIIDTYFSFLIIFKNKIKKDNEFLIIVENILNNYKNKILNFNSNLFIIKYMILNYKFISNIEQNKEENIKLFFDFLLNKNKLVSLTLLKILNKLIEKKIYSEILLNFIIIHFENVINNINFNDTYEFLILMEFIIRNYFNKFFIETNNENIFIITFEYFYKYLINLLNDQKNNNNKNNSFNLELKINTVSKIFNMISYLILNNTKYLQINNQVLLKINNLILEDNLNLLKSSKEIIEDEFNELILKLISSNKIQFDQLMNYINNILNNINIKNINLEFLSNLFYYKNNIFDSNYINNLIINLIVRINLIEEKINNGNEIDVEEINFYTLDFYKERIFLLIILVVSYFYNKLEIKAIDLILNYLIFNFELINEEESFKNILKLFKYNYMDIIVNGLNLCFKYFQPETVNILKENNLFDKFIRFNTNYQSIYMISFNFQIYMLTVFDILDFLIKNNLNNMFYSLILNISYLIKFKIDLSYFKRSLNSSINEIIQTELNNLNNFLNDNCKFFEINWIKLNKKQRINSLYWECIEEKKLKIKNIKFRFIENCYIELYKNKIKNYEENFIISNEFNNKIINDINVMNLILDLCYYKRLLINKKKNHYYRKILIIKK